jgi:hypothetical protein
MSRRLTPTAARDTIEDDDDDNDNDDDDDDDDDEDTAAATPECTTLAADPAAAPTDGARHVDGGGRDSVGTVACGAVHAHARGDSAASLGVPPTDDDGSDETAAPPRRLRGLNDGRGRRAGRWSAGTARLASPRITSSSDGTADGFDDADDDR